MSVTLNCALGSEQEYLDKSSQIPFIRILYKDLHFHPDLASTLQDLSVDIFYALIGQELRKLHFRVMRSEIIRYIIVRWSVSEETFREKHHPSI